MGTRYPKYRRMRLRISISFTLTKLVQTQPSSLPTNMKWTSKGINERKNSIAYESLDIELPQTVKTQSGLELFQYLADMLKFFIETSSRIPTVQTALSSFSLSARTIVCLFFSDAVKHLCTIRGCVRLSVHR